MVEGVLDIDEVAENIPFTYAITAYGADLPVDGIIKRISEGDIFIPLFSLPPTDEPLVPRFQREYVWSKQQADRFIESLLLGLPVPGIFLVKEDSGRHLVLDGHQRLQTLVRFFNNKWEGDGFALQAVQDRFQDCTFETLEPRDRRRLVDSLIHATIVRQDEPSEDLSSIYLIFERLNSGGTSLQPQEIRIALYHGQMVDLLLELNAYRSWRTLFGRRSRRLKDMELVLRFFALFEGSAGYKRPMKGFLNSYLAHRRSPSDALKAEYLELFTATSDAILRGLGPKAFKPQNSVNAAVVDAVMVGVARRIKARGPIRNARSLKRAYTSLLRNKRFLFAISRATADEENVKTRLAVASNAFARAH
jgi:hypothetical protein